MRKIHLPKPVVPLHILQKITQQKKIVVLLATLLFTNLKKKSQNITIYMKLKQNHSRTISIDGTHVLEIFYFFL